MLEGHAPSWPHIKTDATERVPPDDLYFTGSCDQVAERQVLKGWHSVPVGAALAAKQNCHFEGACATEKSYKISHIRSK
jgi:hypothetical protein